MGAPWGPPHMWPGTLNCSVIRNYSHVYSLGSKARYRKPSLSYLILSSVSTTVGHADYSEMLCNARALGQLLVGAVHARLALRAFI